MGSRMRRMVASRLERSTLVVPASNPDMIAKAARSDADAVCIDLEDAVAIDSKEEARGHAVRALIDLDFGSKLRLVRINALDTPFALNDVLALFRHASERLDLLVVPKVAEPDDLRFIDRLLGQLEAAQAGFARAPRIGLEALIEDAAGLLNIREIAGASDRLEALVFGSGDFAASMRMPQETIGGFDEHDTLYPGHRWHHAMAAIVAAARAFGLRAIDGPFAGVRDGVGLERATEIGRVMGFEAKWCIHPRQIATVNHIHSPSPEQLAWAKEVISAYETGLVEGRGAITVRGKMIDAANLRICRQIVAARVGTQSER